MKSKKSQLQGILSLILIISVIILLITVVFGLIPAHYRLWKIRSMRSKDISLKYECQQDKVNYEVWWDSPKCQEWEKFHEKYFDWLMKQ